MAESRPDLAERLSLFLGQQFDGPSRDKLLARRIGVSPRTARHYFNQVWPGAVAWRSIVRVWGSDCINAVFGPEIDAQRAALETEVRALEEALHARQAALRSLARVSQGPPKSEKRGS